MCTDLFLQHTQSLLFLLLLALLLCTSFDSLLERLEQQGHVFGPVFADEYCFEIPQFPFPGGFHSGYQLNILEYEQVILGLLFARNVREGWQDGFFQTTHLITLSHSSHFVEHVHSLQ